MTVLILGATSPIARATAAAYGRRGRRVAVAARDVDAAEAIAADLHVRFEVDSWAHQFDALDVGNHRDLIDAVEDQAGPIDIAVLAFGDMGDQQASQHNFERARQIIDVNYTGAASLCEALAERMAERGHGSIVGLSSVAGDRGRKANYIYGSAKGAFSLYLQGLRNRLDDAGVHVMTAKLGFVDTRMTFGMDSALPVADPADAGQAIVDAQQNSVDVLYFPHFWRAIMDVVKAIPERLFKKLSI